MGMDAGGPSASQLGRRAGDQGVPPDTGHGTAVGLDSRQLALEQRYAAPAMPGQIAPDPGAVGPGPTQLPEYYNYQTAPPAKYDVPTAQKERLSARKAVRDAQPRTGSSTLRVDPISEEEVSYQQHAMAQKKLADFDRYVATLVDPRKPGQLKWLMDVYPEFVERRIQQAHTDYEYALHNQMIDQWGINTFEDLHFKYLVDQGVLNGPSLSKVVQPGDSYEAGLLSPYMRMLPNARDRQRGIRMPFASAQWGKHAANNDDWVIDDDAARNIYADRYTHGEVANGLWSGAPVISSSVSGPASRVRNFGSGTVGGAGTSTAPYEIG